MLRFQFHVDDLLCMGFSQIFVILLIPIVLIVCLVAVKLVISRKSYRCTECEHIFRPKLFQTHLGFHQDISVTERGRDQYCPKCAKITWCRYYPED